MNKLQIKEQKWWDKLEPDKQAAYIQAHPGSQKAQDAKEKEEPEGDLDTQIATAEKEFQQAAQAAQSLGSQAQWNPDPRYDDAANDALKKLKDLKARASGGGEEPKKDEGPKVTEKPGGASHIASSGGNNVLLAKGTADHIARHNKPGEGSVFSDDISMDDVQNAISEIPEEFYEKGGGVHTTTVPNAGYNLVQKASDIKKDHPNAKKIMVKKQVGYDRDKKEPIMKEVPAYIIDDDKEKFKTDQLSVVVRPSNPDFMDDEVKNNSDVKKDLDGKKSHSVLTSFPGDPDVPTADKWEESGHAIIIPNGGKDADKTNWVEEPDTGGGDLTTQIAKAEKEYKSASQAAMAMGQYSQSGDPRYDDAADDALKKLKALKAKKDGKKESITINGKQYKRISESVEPTIFDPLTEAKKQLGGLYTRMIGK